MEQKQTFFSKVSTRKERERAFALLIDTKANIECQLPNKEIVELIAFQILDAHLIVKSEKINISTPTNAIVTFNIGQEKYFIKTSIQKHDLKNHYTLNLEPDLFKLQRRNSFRVQVPSGYHAKLKLIRVDEKKVNKSFVMSDLSGGGFSFEITIDNDFDIKKDQSIQAEIEIGGKFKKNIHAITRYAGSIGSKGSGLKRIGVEFVNLPNSDQQEIVKLVMDLHRDLFSKFKIGTR